VGVEGGKVRGFANVQGVVIEPRTEKAYTKPDQADEDAL
jgi:hypothetical protein